MMAKTVTLIAALALASPTLAAPGTHVTDTAAGDQGWYVSENANSDACFGQARALGARTLAQDNDPATSNGQIISDRAREGTNSEDNQDFIENWCTVPEE